MTREFICKCCSVSLFRNVIFCPSLMRILQGSVGYMNKLEVTVLAEFLPKYNYCVVGVELVVCAPPTPPQAAQIRDIIATWDLLKALSQWSRGSSPCVSFLPRVIEYAGSALRWRPCCAQYHTRNHQVHVRPTTDPIGPLGCFGVLTDPDPEAPQVDRGCCRKRICTAVSRYAAPGPAVCNPPSGGVHPSIRLNRSS